MGTRSLITMLTAFTLAIAIPGCEDDEKKPANDTATPPADVADGSSTTPDTHTPGPDTTAAPDTPSPSFSVPCPAGLAASTETEPNDHWSSSNELGTVSQPGFCVQGAVLCGNDGGDGYGNPGDHFAFQFDAAVSAKFELKWTETADFDLLMSADFENGDLLVTYASGVGTPEGGTPSVEANTTYYVSINCWEGDPGDYALVVTW